VFNSFHYTTDPLLPVVNFKQRDAFVAEVWAAWASFGFTFAGCCSSLSWEQLAAAVILDVEIVALAVGMELAGFAQAAAEIGAGLILFCGPRATRRGRTRPQHATP